MKELIINNLGLIITTLITIIGFIVTYFLNKQNLKNEILKSKQSLFLNKIEDLPNKIMNMISIDLNNNNDKQLQQNYKEIMRQVIGYGGKDLVKTFSIMQQKNYSKELKEFDHILFYAIIISQLKYDLIGEVVNPLYWLKIQLKDYAQNEKKFINTLNTIIKENKLNRKFKSPRYRNYK